MAVSSLPNYFFNLNKWPIDKAPKVSASSYLVGLGLGLLFHLYALPSLEKFIFLTYTFFSYQMQVTGVLFSLVILGILSKKKIFNRIFLILLILAIVFLVVFYYYGISFLHSVYYRNYIAVQSKNLVLNWDFYFFLFFFFGWASKLNKKYSLESYTKGEGYLYRAVLPSIIFFELFTFVYVLIWRYLNTTLAGQATIMYLKSYKYQYIISGLLTKLIFFLACFFFLQVLALDIKQGNHLIFLLKYLVFILVSTFFLFLEFKEFWGFTHQVAPMNLLKFTYFKYFSFMLLFNFFHAYIVILVNFVFIVLLVFKKINYCDYYDFLYLNFKTYYFILWLICLVYLSVYIIHDLHLYIYLT